jgi:hypothetical protein
MARRGGTTSVDAGAQDAARIRINGCGRGDISAGFSDTLRVRTAWAEFALAGGETVKLRAGWAHTQCGSSHTQRLIQVEVLARQHRAATDKKLFGSIDKAFKESNFGAVLVCAGKA